MTTQDVADGARVGQMIRFEYPTNNREGVDLDWRPRIMRVDQIDASPVPQAFIDRDPLLRRYGRRLIGPDFSRGGAVRSFYEGAGRRAMLIRDVGMEIAIGCDPPGDDAQPVSLMRPSMDGLAKTTTEFVVCVTDAPLNADELRRMASYDEAAAMAERLNKAVGPLGTLAFVLARSVTTNAT